MKKLSIGTSDFKEIIEQNCYYVDKTLLIKELIDAEGKVLLFPRPRRFGKTLNLSMLYYFFSNTEQVGYLFENTAIAQDAASMLHQGQYPVIFLSFKDVKVPTWQNALELIAALLSKEFSKHVSIVQPHLSELEQKLYAAILDGSSTRVQLEMSIMLLSSALKRAYNKRVIMLLDEYDTPIHAAFQHGYYKEMVSFARNLMSGALKDNTALELSVLTGILRTAKEGIFSGLNNLLVYTVLDKRYSSYFGFTEPETMQLLTDFKMQDQALQIKAWYNGYQFAGTTIYNPWSILNCVHYDGQLAPYWVNTSDNALVLDIIARADDVVKRELEILLDHQSVYKSIDQAFSFADVEHNSCALWSLLLFSGYLTLRSQQLIEGFWTGELAIPNEEILILYKQLLKRSFDRTLSTLGISQLRYALEKGDGGLFEEVIQKYIINSMSAFDLPNDEPEKSYHLFILGLLVSLSDSYDVVSNRESGFGRYDIMLVPKNPKQRGVIIEFKRVIRKDSLEQSAENALQQIQEKQYAQELQKRGITAITAFGIAFKGKEVLLKQQELSADHI